MGRGVGGGGCERGNERGNGGGRGIVTVLTETFNFSHMLT